MPVAAPILSIGLNEAQVAQLRSILSRGQLKRGTYQAVIRTAGTLKTRAVQLLRDDTNIKRGAAVDAVRVRTDRGDIPIAWLDILGKPIPLSEMSPKVSKRFGVTVQPVKDKPAIKFGHAFRAKMKSGHVGLFLRAKLSVFTAATSLADLTAAGFAEDEAKGILGRHPEAFYGKGIRHLKRLAAGGNFPNVTPQGFAWRLPLKELMGPGAAGIIGVAERLRPFMADGQQILEKNIASQINRFTKPAKN